LAFGAAVWLVAGGIWLGRMWERVREWPRRSAVERRFRELRERGP